MAKLANIRNMTPEEREKRLQLRRSLSAGAQKIQRKASVFMKRESDSVVKSKYEAERGIIANDESPGVYVLDYLENIAKPRLSNPGYQPRKESNQEDNNILLYLCRRSEDLETSDVVPGTIAAQAQESILELNGELLNQTYSLDLDELAKFYSSEGIYINNCLEKDRWISF